MKWISSLLLSLVLAGSLVANAQTETNKAQDNACEAIVAAHSVRQDKHIQDKLQQVFKENHCYQEDASGIKNSLSDGKLGAISKTWISQYMELYSPAGSKQKTKRNPTDGLAPYILTTDDLDFFALNGKILEILQPFTTTPYSNRELLLTAVKQSLSEIKELSDSLRQNYLDQIAGDITRENVRSISNTVIEKLLEQGLFKAVTALQPVRNKAMPVGEFAVNIKALIFKAYDGESKGSESQSSEASQAITIINETSDLQAQGYLLDNQKLNEANYPTIDSSILELVKPLEAIAYPDLQSFSAALERRLYAAINTAVDCEILKKTAAHETSSEIWQRCVAQYRLTDQAGKPFYSSDLAAIDIQPAPGCTSCALPFQGVNYGFYPFWQASEAYGNAGLPVLNPAQTNFSLFTRIAYYGVPVDAEGKITHLMHWKNPNTLGNFVKTLTKYNVKRDLVLYSNSWSEWGADKGEYDRKQLIYSYAEQHLEQIASLHNSVKGQGGLSGITLYFNDYKGSSDATNIISYVQHLRKSIRQGYQNGEHSDFDVNLMLGIDWSSTSEINCKVDGVMDDRNSYFKDLKSLILPQSKMPPLAKNILVYLQTPSSKAKKCLRLQVENEFSGEQRIDALRNIVPILQRIRKAEYSINPYLIAEHDINYLKDNFGGIGIWSSFIQPDDKTDMDTLNHLSDVITRNYRQNYKNYLDWAQLGLVGELINQPVLTDKLNTCAYICPNRSNAGYAFLALFLFSAGLMIAWEVNCKARKAIMRIRWLVVGIKLAALVMFLLMLGCDPLWQRWSDWLLAGVLLPLLAYWGYRFFFCGYELVEEE